MNDPRLVLASIAGAGVGAWGSSKMVEWIEQHQINTQRDFCLKPLEEFFCDGDVV